MKVFAAFLLTFYSIATSYLAVATPPTRNVGSSQPGFVQTPARSPSPGLRTAGSLQRSLSRSASGRQYGSVSRKLPFSDPSQEPAGFQNKIKHPDQADPDRPSHQIHSHQTNMYPGQSFAAPRADIAAAYPDQYGTRFMSPGQSMRQAGKAKQETIQRSPSSDHLQAYAGLL